MVPNIPQSNSMVMLRAFPSGAGTGVDVGEPPQVVQNLPDQIFLPRLSFTRIDGESSLGLKSK